MKIDINDSIFKEIEKYNAKRILLQVPEGLKTESIKIIDKLQDKYEVFLSGDPCYGACDLRSKEAIQLKCDVILHFGHNKFYRDVEEIPVLYVPIDIPIDEEIDYSPIKEHNIRLYSSIQHINSLKKIAEKMKENGKEVVIGGQILGCHVNSPGKNVDAFLFVGSGKFHVSALKEKPVYVFDVEKRIIKLYKKNDKTKYNSIFMAGEAQKFGIIISSKPGQLYMEKAKTAKKRLEEKDKKAYILIMDEITNDKLKGLNIDAFINTACPRISEDIFGKPMINYDDIEEMLKING